MSRIRFGVGSALVLLLGAASAVTAQPGGKPPPVVQFKQFGATPEQFWQSSVLRWTGQLSLDLEAVKGEIAAAKLAPVVRAGINTQVENALLQTLEVERLVRRGAARDKVYAAFADVDKSLVGLQTAVNQNATAKQATAASLARAGTAYHQLAAAVGAGDNDQARVRRRLLRLADALDENAEELRAAAGDLLRKDRVLDRALSEYAREDRLLAVRVRADDDPKVVAQTYALMADHWAVAVTQLGGVRNLPAAIQAQATRVDDLHRRLGTALNLPPVPAGPNPPPPLPTAKRFSFAVGADAPAQPHVVVFADEKGTVAYSFYAYDQAFTGGVRVDMADLNGDRVPDLIVAPGPSQAAVQPVRVYDGRDLNLLVEFVPFPNWKGGVHASGSDLTKDGRALIAVTADGTQHIKVFDLAQGKEVESFHAHNEKVTGGVRIAWGDANGDGVPDLFTTNGPGNAVTVVKVFNGKNREVLAEFPVVDNKYRGGAHIAAGDLTGNGTADAVVGLDEGSAPLVRVFDLRGKVRVEWLAYDETFRGGVRVALSARNHVVTGPGAGFKNSPLRVFATGNVKTPVSEFVPFVGFDGGLNVGGR